MTFKDLLALFYKHYDEKLLINFLIHIYKYANSVQNDYDYDETNFDILYTEIDDYCEALYPDPYYNIPLQEFLADLGDSIDSLTKEQVKLRLC